MLLRVIFISCLFTLICCYDFINMIPNKEMEDHPFEEHDTKICNHRDFKMNHSRIVKESMCNMPRDTIVQLIPDSPDIKYTPSAVVLKRCGGMCSNNHLTCIPTEMRKVTIGVRRHKHGESTSTCGKVTVEEHVMCRCLCAVMEEHCNKKQNYDEEGCMCRCNNMVEKKTCEMNEKLWDQKDCKCSCKEEQECSTGLSWVPSHCKCMKVMDHE